MAKKKDSPQNSTSKTKSSPLSSSPPDLECTDEEYKDLLSIASSLTQN
jgi:hypothetical protein